MNPGRVALVFMFAFLSAAAPLFAAPGGQVGTFTMEMNQDPGVVMGDSTATLTLTVTNTTASGTASIGWLRLDVVESLYYVSFSNQAPDGWSVVEIKNAGLGQSYITYEATTGALAPGESQTFEVVLTGSGDGPFVADVNDITDTFYSVSVKEDGSKKPGAFTGTAPSWTRYSLKPSLTATPTSVGSTDTITVQLSLINRSTVTQAAVSPVAPVASGSGTISMLSGPSPASTTIDPGGVQLYTYTYTASSFGTVALTSRGTNGMGDVTSPLVTSNTVTIGNFTAEAELSPEVVISGQDCTVTLTLRNNGPVALGKVVPNITTSGTATMTLDSGPRPAGAGALNPGASKTFVWKYTVTGGVGDTFGATAWGTCSTGSSNTAQTVTGEVSAYSVSVSPESVTSGATNVSVSFTVYNNGGLPVQKVGVSTPTGWAYQSAVPPAGWSTGSSGNPTVVSFSTGSSYISVGGNETFTLTFSQVPSVPSDTPYNFLVELWDTGQSQLNKDPRGAIETTFVVTPYLINVTCVDPDGPPAQVADGYQFYNILSSLEFNSAPVANANIQFTTTAGALGSGTVLTDSSGEAFNTLTGTLSTTTVDGTVTAQYLGAAASAECVFDPYGGLALDYVPGSLSPVSATAGSTGLVFKTGVINAGTTSIDLDEGSTYFLFNDSTVGGSATFQAYLDIAAPTVIPSGGAAVLTFLAADVDPGFSSGSFYPQLFLDDGTSSGSRTVTDPVTITGSGTKILIIRWHENIQ